MCLVPSITANDSKREDEEDEENLETDVFLLVSYFSGSSFPLNLIYTN